jgi:integrase/recombinase XerD
MDSAVAIPERGETWTFGRLMAAWLLSYSSECTRRAYKHDAMCWFRFCAGVNVDPLVAVRVHVDAFARTMEAERAAPATISRRLAAVSSFYTYAVDMGAVLSNPAARVKRPRPPEMSSTRWLDTDEIRSFIDIARQHGPRDHLVALLLGLSGLRAGELLSLRIEEIGAFGKHTTILVHGKGGRDERVPIPFITADVLDEVVGDRDYGWVFDGGPWRGWRTGLPGGGLDSLPAHVDRSQMSYDQLRRVVTRLSNRAGLNARNPKVTPHSFRHGAITAALDAGAAPRDVEVLARHLDPRTTRRYDRTRTDFARHASYLLEKVILG